MTTPCPPGRVDPIQSYGIGLGLVGYSAPRSERGARGYAGVETHHVARRDRADRLRVAVLVGASVLLGRGIAIGAELQGAVDTHAEAAAADDRFSLTPLLHVSVGR